MASPAVNILSVREKRAKLKRMGFRRNSAVVWGPQIGVGVVVLLAFAAGALVHYYPTGNPRIEGKDVVALVIAAGAFVMGFQQWGAVRREASLERTYERLDRANDHLYECAAARPLLHPAYRDSEQYLRDLYVCIELDNLEYTIEKYRMGYMAPRNAYRAMETFRSRCFNSPEFRKLARRCARNHVYNGETRVVVERILDDLGLDDGLDEGRSRWMRVVRRDTAKHRAAPPHRPMHASDAKAG